MDGDGPSKIESPQPEELNMSKRVKLYIPDTRASIRRCSTQIIAFAVSFSGLSIILFTLILFLQLTILGYWADNYRELTETLPRTFSWEILIRMFGSVYNDCMDRSGPQPVQLTDSKHCPNDFTVPAVPIIAMTLLTGSSLTGLMCFISWLTKRLIPIPALRTVWVFAVFQFIFFMGAIIPLSLSFSGDQSVRNRLVARMSSEMQIASSVPTEISPRWELTQVTHECCGLRSFTDWNFSVFPKNENPRYPRSCCNHLKSNCKAYPTRREVFQRGCVDLEFDRVEEIGMQAIYLLCVGLISTVLQGICLTLTQTIFRGDLDMEFSARPSPLSVSDQNSNLIGSLSPPDKIPSPKPWRLLSLKRQTNINVRLSGWGIIINSKTTSLSRAQILKKETLV